MYSNYRRRRIVARLCTLSICAALLLATPPARADTPAVTAAPEISPLTISVTPSRQFDVALHGGGGVSATRYLFDINAYQPLSQTFGAGLHFAYEGGDYRFTNPAAFAAGHPWEKLHRLEFGGTVAYDLNPLWSIYILPMVQFSREDGAGWNNALSYGGDLTITRDITPRLTLGLGVEILEDLGEVSILPLVVINWKITDRLLLANLSRPGPVGTMGVELTYSIGAGWELATGGAYLSNRFRLSSAGAYPDAIADISSFPVWGRLTKGVGKHFNIDIYGGAMFAGELQVEDKDGGRIASDRYDPAPFLALALSARF